MFQAILINAIIWVAICKMSFFCSKFTTMAQYNWFHDVEFAIENFAKHKLKSDKLTQMVLNLSYSKAFYCRPCHAFWLSLGMFYFAFRIESSFYAFFVAFILALFTYLMANGLDKVKAVKTTIEQCEAVPWINSRSQFGGYDGAKQKTNDKNDKWRQPARN